MPFQTFLFGQHTFLNRFDHLKIMDNQLDVSPKSLGLDNQYKKIYDVPMKFAGKLIHGWQVHLCHTHCDYMYSKSAQCFM